MKKNISSNQLKNIGYVFGYWVVCLIVPVWLMFYLNNKSLGRINIFTPMIWYSMFIIPILFIIPYRFARPRSSGIFIFLGLIVPYVCMYYFI